VDGRHQTLRAGQGQRGAVGGEDGQGPTTVGSGQKRVGLGRVGPGRVRQDYGAVDLTGPRPRTVEDGSASGVGAGFTRAGSEVPLGPRRPEGVYASGESERIGRSPGAAT